MVVRVHVQVMRTYADLPALMAITGLMGPTGMRRERAPASGERGERNGRERGERRDRGARGPGRVDASMRQTGTDRTVLLWAALLLGAAVGGQRTYRARSA